MSKMYGVVTLTKKELTKPYSRQIINLPGHILFIEHSHSQETTKSMTEVKPDQDGPDSQSSVFMVYVPSFCDFAGITVR